jgi:AraC family transcriptional regulator of adaptative response / methylphosphotriester-DNA alkyltransferase methyltransferase
MKKLGRIFEDEKYEAVINCDKDYDGIFFYGVKTTGVFCRPSCKSKTPLRGNVVFFDSSAMALEAGFRPCKRCCPDKEVFQPHMEILKNAKEIIDRNYNNKISLSNISKEIGVSSNHLIRLFKYHSRVTPTQYLAKVRIQKAEESLKKGEKTIIDIAYDTGFKSLSNFYRCFREETGLTPKEMQRKVMGTK